MAPPGSSSSSSAAAALAPLRPWAMQYELASINCRLLVVLQIVADQQAFDDRRDEQRLARPRRRRASAWDAKHQDCDAAQCRRGRSAGTAAAHFAVGITNSAPLPMLSGQRCMIDFCLV